MASMATRRNPLYRLPRTKTVTKYPITVSCVVASLDDRHTELQAIRAHCIKKNILFTTRIYMPHKYSEDCDIIERLPALHIYVNSCYKDTFYSDTQPFLVIDNTIANYKEVAKERLRSSIKNVLYNIIQGIIDVFRRKNKHTIEWS